MINSMTGYGEAQGEINGVNYLVEIKTVNHRYFKAIIRLPEPVAFVEEDVDKLLKDNMSRGTINYVLRLKNSSINALFDIDETALKTIIEKLNRAASSTGIKEEIDISNLLSLPGVIQPALPDKKTSEQIREKVLQVSREAIDKVKQMRATEGNFLEDDLKKHCSSIEKDLEQIRARGDIVLKEYSAKLRQRVDALLAEAKLKLDEETLAREVAIFAERSDISEEVARLDSHLQQFVQACRSNELAGRRLDFISQEMLREANTIASKASDTNIIRCVVDIKCQIDRIKEQVQNIE
ncbi:MAG: YicC family protein [Sedimentisphaerales bacterium]|nr:YicC family protein [Sedimentisphaerales bacterium]